MDDVVVRLKVLLFASAREISGISEGEIEVSHKETYQSLLTKVIEQFSLKKLQNTIILAINEEYPDPNCDLLLKNSDIIAVIPPLSGG